MMTNLGRSTKPLRLNNVRSPPVPTRSHNKRIFGSAISISKHILDVFKRVLARGGYRLQLQQNAVSIYELIQNEDRIGDLVVFPGPNFIAVNVNIKNPKYSPNSEVWDRDHRSRIGFFGVKFHIAQLSKVRKQALILLKKLSHKEVWDVMKL